MLAFFILIKDALTIFGPLVAIEFYMRAIYHVGLSKVVVWWFKESHTLDYNYGGPLLIGLFFSYLAVFATLAHLIQAGSLAFQGENHRLVYIGDVTKTRSLFVPPDDLTSEPKVYLDFVGGFNYSFSSIFTETIFQRDKGTERLGGTVKSFSFGSLLSSLVLLIAFVFPLMGVVHFYAYPVSVGLPNTPFDGSLPGMEALDLMLKGLGLGVVKAIFIIFGLLILVFFSQALRPTETYGKQIINLPEHITPDNVIEGQPIYVKHHTSRSSDSSGSYSDVDTGFRTIVFKFEKDFPTAVYVSTYYDSRERPGLGNLAYQNSQTNTPMKLMIQDDLSIKVID